MFCNLHCSHVASVVIQELNLFIYLFLRQSFTLVAQAGVQWRDLGSLQAHLLGGNRPPVSAS